MHHHFTSMTWRHHYRHCHYHHRHHSRHRPRTIIVGFGHIILFLTIILFFHVYRGRIDRIGTFLQNYRYFLTTQLRNRFLPFAHMNVQDLLNLFVQDKTQKMTSSSTETAAAAVVAATAPAVATAANGDDRRCIDLCAWSAARGVPRRPASTRISTPTPRLRCAMSSPPIQPSFFCSIYHLFCWHLALSAQIKMKRCKYPYHANYEQFKEIIRKAWNVDLNNQFIKIK